MISSVSNILNSVVFVGFIIAHVAYSKNNASLESGEKLDRQLYDLQEEEAVLRRRIYNDYLSYEEYHRLQVEIDNIGHQIAMCLQEQQGDNCFISD